MHKQRTQLLGKTKESERDCSYFTLPPGESSLRRGEGAAQIRLEIGSSHSERHPPRSITHDPPGGRVKKCPTISLRAAAIAMLVLFIVPPSAHAQFFGGPKPAEAVAEPVESAKRALQRTAPPWYDVEQDDVKSLEIEAEEQPEPRAKWEPETPKWKWNWNWPSFSFFGEFLRFAGWALLIGLLAVLVYALVRAFMNVDPAIAGITGKQEEYDVRADQERIENLPLPVSPRKGKGSFLDIARQFYKDGNFADAIVYLFSHRLLQLDRAGRIRLTKGKTNRQYLREIRNSKDLQRILGSTIVNFEEVFFGNHALSREQFEKCWKHNESFEQLLQQVTA